MCPVLDESGPYEYLGRTYSIKYFNTEEEFASLLESASTDSQTIDENTFDIEALFSNLQGQEQIIEETAQTPQQEPQEV